MKIHGVSLQDLYKIYMKEIVITKTMSPLACQGGCRWGNSATPVALSHHLQHRTREVTHYFLVIIYLLHETN